jgi:hypothetical protein
LPRFVEANFEELFSNFIPWDVRKGLVYAAQTIKDVSILDEGTHLMR